MTKNTTRYCFAVIIIGLGLQLIACQSTSKPPVETALQISPGTMTQQLSQTNGVSAVAETPPVLESTVTVEKTMIPESTTIPTIVLLPSMTSTPIPSATPTSTSEPELTFQLAFVLWPGEGNTHGIWSYLAETQESTLLVAAKPDTYIDPIIQLRPDKTAIGYTVAEVDGTWAVWEVEIATGEATQLTPLFLSSEYHGFLEGWSPDQQWLYIRLRDTTVLQEEHQIAFNLNTQESIEVEDFVLGWSPITPNRYISIGKENETRILKVVDIGGELLTFQAPKQQLPAVARWAPNGQKIAIGLGGGINKPTSFFILDLETGLIQSIFNGNLWITGWSPDGKWIAFNDNTGLILFNSQKLAPVTISEFNSKQLFPIAWLDSETFLIQLDESLFIVTPAQPESIVELIQLNDLYPNLDPFTHLIAWAP